MRPVSSVAVFAFLLAVGVVLAAEPAAKKDAAVEVAPAKKDIPDAKQAVKETAPAAEEGTAAGKDGEPLPRIFRRIIPADVLRDFPQHCFASTLCKLFEPDQDWSLDPFCGQSHCHLDEKLGRLFEIVLDCGPKPLNPDTCKVLKPGNDTGSFPTCCDVYDPETCKFPDLAGPPKDRIKLRTNKANKAEGSSEGSTSSGSAASGAGSEATSSGDAAQPVQEVTTTSEAPAPTRPAARARGRGRPRVEAASQEEAPAADKKSA